MISASNRDLQAMIERREFREDLYYRCHVIGIELPSLRERPEDVPVLVHHFLRKYAQLLRKNVFRVSPALMQRLVAHPWPGNVRELENTVERLVNMTDAETACVEDLPAWFSGGQKPTPCRRRRCARPPRCARSRRSRRRRSRMRCVPAAST